MKKISLFVVLSILFLSCDNEHNGKDLRFCDTDYVWESSVKNEANKEIAVSVDNKYATGQLYTIAPGQTAIIMKSKLTLSTCDPLAIDFYRDILNADRLEGLSMTVGSMKIADEIWLLDHWAFATDPSTRNTQASYTLTVTNELLNSLPSVKAE